MLRRDLAAELVAMATDDERVREQLAASGRLFEGYPAEMRAVHRRNGDRLTAIIVELDGWPGKSAVGAEAAHAAWLILQHDVANPPLLRRCLPLLEAAAANGDAEPSAVAYLHDRIRAFEGRPQRYGTQLGFDDSGQLVAWPPVEEPESVDQRRQTVGLGPLAEQIGAARVQVKAPEDPREHRRQAEEFARAVGWR